ncbi:hypothetical protein [Coleofasciculus sp. FACHB-712]|uniref:hypothetical protein n=1 Tax=Coleofasciculus sp. FACHB-712 TaxID=2692789 RepID=UPI00168881C7|nr:hypothetical protein [Coleofasciculus sp. FACHB-712]
MNRSLSQFFKFWGKGAQNQCSKGLAVIDGNEYFLMVGGSRKRSLPASLANDQWVDRVPRKQALALV